MKKKGKQYLTFEDRLWSHVNKEAPNGCWLWTASATRPNDKGYGHIRVNGTLKVAHRVTYELLVGAIPEGLDLDHKCRVRRCVNPKHLEPVTRSENIKRGDTVAMGRWNTEKTHCTKGHPYSGDNVYINPAGSRGCRTCRRASRTNHELQMEA